MTEQAVTEIIEYQLQDAIKIKQSWFHEWEKAADDCLINEPQTLAYEAAVSLKDESKVLVFRRHLYAPSRVGLQRQRTTKERFDEVIVGQAMPVNNTLSGTFIDVPDFGWWVRPDRERTRSAKTTGGSILLIAVWRIEKPAMIEPFLKLSRTHLEYCWENEPDTLTYSCGVADQDFNHVDIDRDDFVFVIEFSDMQALDKHVDDPRHQAMVEKIKAAGIRAEVPYRQLYRTTGLGFMCRVPAS